MVSRSELFLCLGLDIVMLSFPGLVSTLAGGSTSGLVVDGVGTNSAFKAGISGIFGDTAGLLRVCTVNNFARIRLINSAGTISYWNSYCLNLCNFCLVSKEW
jgi:hypothetical protein